MPDPPDTAAPIDGQSKDEASSFLESLGLSKAGQPPRHAVAAPVPDGRAIVADRVPKPPAISEVASARAARQSARPGLYRRLRDEVGVADPRAEVLETVRERIHRRVITELGPVFYNSVVDPKELRTRVEGIVQTALRGEKTPMSVQETAQVGQVVTDEVLGHGPIERFVRDPTVSEIMVNGPDQIYIERNGRLERTRISFVSDAQLRHVIARIVGEVGRHIDESSPMVDARLPDGSRVNAVFPPLCIGGPFLTIRKFAADPLMVEDLIDFGTLTPQVAELLKGCVQGKANIMISGGAGTGKTTMLNVLSSFIPSDERIITIEDAKELQLQQDHVLCLEYRPANTEGSGEVTIRDLLRNCLRMRPDRIIIGECRSGEALDMLQAMNTGHEGSLTTVHANSPRDALSRVETMTLMAGFDLPIRAVREQMAAALDLVVHLSRMRDGSRRVTHVTEVGGMEGEVILLQDVFIYDFRMGHDNDGHSLGYLKATGIRPHITQRLADRGVKLDPTIFDVDVTSRAAVPQLVATPPVWSGAPAVRR
jgi:pilus assembly protein CpaF